MKHHVGMMVACLLPMALIYSLPYLGIESGALLVLLLAGCVIVHLVMMKGHGHGHPENDKAQGNDDTR